MDRLVRQGVRHRPPPFGHSCVHDLRILVAAPGGRRCADHRRGHDDELDLPCAVPGEPAGFRPAGVGRRAQLPDLLHSARRLLRHVVPLFHLQPHLLGAAFGAAVVRAVHGFGHTRELHRQPRRAPRRARVQGFEPNLQRLGLHHALQGRPDRLLRHGGVVHGGARVFVDQGVRLRYRTLPVHLPAEHDPQEVSHRARGHGGHQDEQRQHDGLHPQGCFRDGRRVGFPQ
mmetsp:Transcript_128036/g.250725  ORF Transcript_128036/g.250725 Transcript_128036/m.250725 type:complete len:229 (+) Transcript_128036:556-1242(+)